MSEKDFARRLMRHARAAAAAKSKPAQALLAWTKAERDWLWPGAGWSRGKKTGDAGSKTLGWATLPALVEEIGDDSPALEPPMETGAAIAAILAFGNFDRALLAAAIALHRLPRLAGCARGSTMPAST